MRKIIAVLLLLLSVVSAAQAQSVAPTNPNYEEMMQQMATPAAPRAAASLSFAGDGLNDMRIVGAYTGATAATFVIEITGTATPNRFAWTETGGSGGSASNVSCAAGAHALADGISVQFTAATGHTLGDTWTIVARPRSRTFWDANGIRKTIWSDSTVVTMSGAMGASFDPASPGTIGGTAAGIVHTTSGIWHGSTSGTITVNAPAIAGTQTYTWPTGVPGGNGYALTATTGGVMSWAAVTADWANPGTIGSGTANTGKFTTLQTTGISTIGDDVNIANTKKVGYLNGPGITYYNTHMVGSGQLGYGGFNKGGALTGAVTFDFDNNPSFYATLAGNITVTFANGLAGVEYILFITQDATGSRTVTWPVGLKWAGGAAPTLTTTAGKTDIIYVRFDGAGGSFGRAELNY